MGGVAFLVLTKVRFDGDKVPFRRRQSAALTLAKCRFKGRRSTVRLPSVYSFFFTFHFSFFTFHFKNRPPPHF